MHASAEFDRRAQGGVPEDVPEVHLSGAPMAIGPLLRAAGLVTSSAEGLRNVEQAGVRIDGATVSDRGLKLEAGSYLIQVGKRRFARVLLS